MPPALKGACWRIFAAYAPRPKGSLLAHYYIFSNICIKNLGLDFEKTVFCASRHPLGRGAEVSKTI